MRRSSSRPWPAFVDLFSALFIATLAGFVLLTGKTKLQIEKARIRAAVDSTNKRLKSVLQSSEETNFNVEQQGDEIVFDLYIEFERNSDEIKNEEDVETIRRLAKTVQRSIDKLPEKRRSVVQVVIEGHSDQQRVYGISDPRARYLFNWNLSSQRATSVLYEVRQAGLSPNSYSVVAIGYGDTRPRCTQDTPECHRKNRRTSIRLSPDMGLIERQIEDEAPDGVDVSTGKSSIRGLGAVGLTESTCQRC